MIIKALGMSEVLNEMLKPNEARDDEEYKRLEAIRAKRRDKSKKCDITRVVGKPLCSEDSATKPISAMKEVESSMRANASEIFSTANSRDVLASSALGTPNASEIFGLGKASEGLASAFGSADDKKLFKSWGGFDKYTNLFGSDDNEDILFGNTKRVKSDKDDENE
jgi:hypothetical protein